MRLPQRREPTPEEIMSPPPEQGPAGMYLGFDAKARFAQGGLPLRRDWWSDAIFGGRRQVGEVARVEATSIVLGGPGVGKSQLLAGQAVLKPHRGPLLIATTKTDLPRWVGHLRELQTGGRILIVDWYGTQAATLPWPRVKWSILDGCRDPDTALDRMTAMVETVSLGRPTEKAFWDVHAAQILASLAHSSALEGSGLDRMLARLRSEELDEPQRLMAAHGSASGLGDDLSALAGKADETRQNMFMSARVAMFCLSSPTVLDGCSPSPDDALDIDAFLDSEDTLIILDKGKTSKMATTAPLSVALISAIIEHAETKADATSAAPGRIAGTLAKPLRCLIDEVSNLSPLPNLPNILSQARGRGIEVSLAAQSRRQIAERWGKEGAGAILDTCAFTLVGAGLESDMDYMTSLSKSLGERKVWRPSVQSQKASGASGRGGSSEGWSMAEVPEVKASHIAKLPEGAAILLGREGWRVVKLPPLPPLLHALAQNAERALLTPGDPEYGPETWGWPPPRPSWWRRALGGSQP